MGKLTAAFIKHAKPGKYADGDNLYLQVKPAGSKAWLFRYTDARGKPRWLGFGSYKFYSLKEARERARHVNRQRAEGHDAGAVIRAMKGQGVKAMTFAEACDRYIAAHEHAWKNDKHKYQWRQSLASHAGPALGEKDIAAIRTDDVMRALEPIWKTKTETATRLRGRIEAVLDWAKVRGLRDGENPARWRGHLDKLLPAPRKIAKVRHQPAMPYDELPAFAGELRARGDISARALEFTILTACRTGEVIGAVWAEIDLDGALWTVPGERTKTGQPHRVPLTDRAVTILRGLPRERSNPHVFVGARRGRGLSNMAMLELLRGMRQDGGLTVHGFRSSFRDWAAETTSFPNHVCEMALGHVVRGVEGDYRRGDLLDKRRRLMEAWTGYCVKPAGAAGCAVPIRKARA